ncbi:hypothetical protein NIM87_18405 [Devosia sp. XJ19-1]|uniref:Uncharacterized protein n=1 Tax=Devosia ureilytica TaxID=2952754 RepID=A0A9Q4AT93_9HYPH|nr:hypothetical protein [Devosia ureilytica]MCP8885477.1 hypothetical protein [Devosia ureilytica]MCP8889066.1 hypothetical protein [Devosia ureilytica]
MRTIAQKRARAKKMKVAAGLLLVAAVFTPKLDNLTLPSVPFPFVTTAIAAEIQ